MTDRINGIQVGTPIIFHDAVGEPNNALVTEVWPGGMVNVVFVSSDKAKHDSYGRQIERATSIPHRDGTSVHGVYWRFEDESVRPYTPPVRV